LCVAHILSPESKPYTWRPCGQTCKSRSRFELKPGLLVSYCLRRAFKFQIEIPPQTWPSSILFDFCSLGVNLTTRGIGAQYLLALAQPGRDNILHACQCTDAKEGLRHDGPSLIRASVAHSLSFVRLGVKNTTRGRGAQYFPAMTGFPRTSTHEHEWGIST